MEEASSTRRVELVMKLPQLQNLIKRDPAAYRDEFEQQVSLVNSPPSLPPRHRQLPTPLFPFAAPPLFVAATAIPS